MGPGVSAPRAGSDKANIDGGCPDSPARRQNTRWLAGKPEQGQSAHGALREPQQTRCSSSVSLLPINTDTEQEKHPLPKEEAREGSYTPGEDNNKNATFRLFAEMFLNSAKS